MIFHHLNRKILSECSSSSGMEAMLGLLRVRVLRGVNLAVRDSRSSDPYVTLTMDQLILRTPVVKNNCNPVWNEELTLTVSDLDAQITLAVYDKDKFKDDTMGEVEIDIKPYINCVKMGLENLPDGCVVKRVHPNRKNGLSEESACVWINGKLVQEMCLRLNKVEQGELVIQVEWVDVPGAKGLQVD